MHIRFKTRTVLAIFLLHLTFSGALGKSDKAPDTHSEYAGTDFTTQSERDFIGPSLFRSNIWQRVTQGFPKKDISGYDWDELDSIIVETMETYHYAGLSACIVGHGQTVWTGSYGYADILEAIEAEDSTVFMLASISKTFVATAVMQLWEEGEIGLDDDISGYLPFSVTNPYYPDSAISVRQILAHTSSIAYNHDVWIPLITWGGDSPIGLGEFLAEYLVPGGELYNVSNYNNYPPGMGAEYSNIAYALAGLLVEEITGMSFEDYCQDNLFGPLQMYETSWFLSGLDVGNVAVPTGFSGSYFQYGHYGFPVYPCGQLRTSSIQLARHLIAFMQYGQIDGVRILDSATVAMMKTVQYPDYPVFPEWGYQWGLGWYSVETPVGWLWGHEGGIFGVNTLMFYNPVEESGILFLVNSDGSDGITTIFLELLERSRDPDLDSIVAGYDNCPFDYNPDQVDSDADGIGDACDWLCGDADGSGMVDIDDVVYLVAYIFSGGSEPNPYEAGDADESGAIDIDDVVYLITYIFSGGPGPCE